MHTKITAKPISATLQPATGVGPGTTTSKLDVAALPEAAQEGLQHEVDKLEKASQPRGTVPGGGRPESTGLPIQPSGSGIEPPPSSLSGTLSPEDAARVADQVIAGMVAALGRAPSEASREAIRGHLVAMLGRPGEPQAPTAGASPGAVQRPDEPSKAH